MWSWFGIYISFLAFARFGWFTDTFRFDEMNGLEGKFSHFSLFFLLSGVASVINHTSELFAYFFLHELIHRFGHIKILFLGLLGNFVRFVYISLITNPWWVLPFEFIQGTNEEFVGEMRTSMVFIQD